MKTDWLIIPILTSSKNALAVASTSAEALCASLKLSLKRKEYNSIRVGNLNFPPLPPGILHTFAVSSVHVSNISFSSKLTLEFILNSSAPIIFRSNLTLWPIINPARLRSWINLSSTLTKSSPILLAKEVEMPWIFSDSYGIL